MKVIAALYADLDRSPIGTRSRLAGELLGVPVLRRTVERLRRARRLDAIYVLCPSAQLERCTSLVRGTGVVVRPTSGGGPSWGPLVQCARKWSLDGWRGGIGGACSFDEFTDPRVLSGLLGDVTADAVLSVPAAAALIDPVLADRIIEHADQAGDEIRLTFTQAPPGLAGVLLKADLIHELREKSTPLGWVFAYQPDVPRKDLIFQPCCCEIPLELRYAVGRLIADTDRTMEAIAALLRDHPDPDLVTVGTWLAVREASYVPPVPREVEIELTTDDPHPDAMLRPRGARLARRGPIDSRSVHEVVRAVCRYDDALVVLGGFGDPLRHPRFNEILETVRAAVPDGPGPYGLAVRTTAADLTEEHIAALIRHRVDVLQVLLDAWSPDLYGRLQSPGDPSAVSLENLRRRIEQVTALRQRATSVMPIVLPTMTKALDNLHELDEFHDGWMRRLGAVLIAGYGHYARQCQDRSVMCMAPPDRVPCRRIRSRCLVLADGRVTLCDQDLHGYHAVGSLSAQSLGEIWQGQGFSAVRAAHASGRFDPTPLCAACDEWHRP